MPSRRALRLAALIAVVTVTPGLEAQEGAGQAEIGFQNYYLRVGTQRLANISGLTLNYTEFIPKVGLISAGFSPALSNERFRTGDQYFRIKGAPWKGQHWDLGVGDFSTSGAVIPNPFTNLYVPQIAGRGFSAEASHGGRTVSFFYGKATLSNTPRVVLRVTTPQTIAGVSVRQALGTRLLLGARLIRFSNDPTSLRDAPYVTPDFRALRTVTNVSSYATYRFSSALQWYTEATWSAAATERGSRLKQEPFSVLTGPLLETRILSVRANYTRQSTSYLPLLGYYLGDRAGPFAEVRLRPARFLEVYGSASRYHSNIANDAVASTFRSGTESTGFSLQLPSKISVNGQYVLLDLASRSNNGSAWNYSRNRQTTATIARPFARHSVRFSGREFRQESTIGRQRQRSAEIEDTFHTRSFLFSGGVRLQHAQSTDSRTTLYFRGAAQFNRKRFSAYTNFESGNDLLNQTLFAKNTTTSTVVGTALTFRKSWDFQAEAFRNNLVTVLNPESIFALQSQGVGLPNVLAALNQWSVYLRVTRRFHWGKAGGSDLSVYAKARTPLVGSVEGYVRESGKDGNSGVEGIAVTIDGGQIVSSGLDGHYRFSDVPEGAHSIELALDQLPAELEPEVAKTSAVVAANRVSRTDLTVARLDS